MTRRATPVTSADLLYGGATRGKTFIPLASGAHFDLLAPGPSVLDLAELGWALARTCRFAGRTTRFYSVAEHSMLVAGNLPPELRLYGLLHDAHEALIGDMNSPVKAALVELGAGEALARLDLTAAAAVHAAAGLPFPPPAAVSDAIDLADRRALATERAQILPEGATRGWGEDLPPPYPVVLAGLNWTRAGERFEERLRLYGAPQRRAA